MIEPTYSIFSLREFVNAVPPRLIMWIFVLCLILVAYIGSYISKKFFPNLLQDEEKELLTNQIIAVLWGGYSIILGFIMITCWENMTQTRTNLITEASSLAMIVRQVEAYPEENQKEIVQAVGDYVKATREEWNYMRHGKFNPAAFDALTHLNHVLIQAYPHDKTNTAVSQQIVVNYNEVLNGRFQRLGELRDFIPSILREMLFTGAAFLMFVTGFLRTTEHFARSFCFFSFALLIGFLLGLSTSFSYPFSGTFAVSDKVFRDAILAKF